MDDTFDLMVQKLILLENYINQMAHRHKLQDNRVLIRGLNNISPSEKGTSIDHLYTLLFQANVPYFWIVKNHINEKENSVILECINHTVAKETHSRILKYLS